MKKLNILIVCDAATHQLGGSFISSLRFSELLKKRGHNVIFIAAKYPNTSEIDYYKKIKIYRFRSISLPKFENLIRLAFPTKAETDKIIKQEKIDIVHIMVPAPASLTCIKSARENKVKIVPHSHTQPENILVHLPFFLRTKLFNFLMYKYLIWMYKKTDLTACPSKFAERALKKHEPKLKTAVISNGVDIYRFKKLNPYYFFEKFNLPRKNPKILYVGRLHPEKNINTLINSMKYVKENKNVILEIVGIGYLKDSLEKLSKNLGLTGNIKFLGKVSDKDLVYAYNSCDIFVLPSLAELEGMVVLEAMACGKPIIIANSENSASVDFVDGNGFLFKPEDPKDLAKKILKLLKDEKLMKEMALKSFKNSRSYNIERSIDKLEELYYSLLNGRKISKN